MHHFHPPEIKGAKTESEWITAVLIWIAFRSMRAQGDAHE